MDEKEHKHDNINYLGFSTSVYRDSRGDVTKVTTNAKSIDDKAKVSFYLYLEGYLEWGGTYGDLTYENVYNYIYETMEREDSLSEPSEPSESLKQAEFWK